MAFDDLSAWWWVLLSDGALAMVVLVLASVVGDVVHLALHKSESMPAPLCWPSRLHMAHHAFYDDALRFQERLYERNLWLHQLPELGTRLVASAVLGWWLGLTPFGAGLVVGVWCTDAAWSVVRRGRDRFHLGQATPPSSTMWWVDAGYHARHHVSTDVAYGAHFSVIDMVLGTTIALRDRRVVVVGGSQFCADLCDALDDVGARWERLAADTLTSPATPPLAGGDASAWVEGARVERPMLGDVDVLVLGQGAHQRDASSYEAFVTLALDQRNRPLPLEVWALGSSPAWEARAPMFSDRVLLRRLRRAPMLGARRTLSLIRRGARQV